MADLAARASPLGAVVSEADEAEGVEAAEEEGESDEPPPPPPF